MSQMGGNSEQLSELKERVENVDVRTSDVARGKAAVSWLLDNDLRLRQLVSDQRLNIDQLTVSVSSLAQYLDELLGSQLEFAGKPNFAEVQTQIKGTIISELVYVSWAKVPWTILSRNTLLNRLYRILDRPLGESANTRYPIDSMN
jgi:hypothetical protein